MSNCPGIRISELDTMVMVGEGDYIVINDNNAITKRIGFADFVGSLNANPDVRLTTYARDVIIQSPNGSNNQLWLRIAGQYPQNQEVANNYLLAEVVKQKDRLTALDVRLTTLEQTNNNYVTKSYVDQQIAIERTLREAADSQLMNVKADKYNVYTKAEVDQLIDEVILDGGGIPDAPIDGKAYARKDEKWIVTIVDAPADGNMYVRQDNAWVLSGSGVTNLGINNHIGTTLDITSSTGTGVTIPAATTVLAGLMTATDKTNLDALVAGGGQYTDADVDAHLNSASATDGQILSYTSGDYLWVDEPTGFSGDYNDLTNKPAIPANTSDLVNDSGFITSAEAPVQPGDLFSGDYNDLTNKPTIPAEYTDADVDAHLNQSSAQPNYVLEWSGTDYTWVSPNSVGGQYGDDDVESLFQNYDFHLIPGTNATYDIGTAEKKVRHLFLSDNSLRFVDAGDNEYPLSVSAGPILTFNGEALALKSEIPSPVVPGDGALTIQTAGEGATATGTFTANQTAGSTITLPTIRYEDLSGTPTIPSDYVLPVATDSVLGGVKVGARLTIDADGILTADIQGGGGTTVGTLQEVTDEGNTTDNSIIINNNINLNSDGTVTATSANIGTLTISSNTISSSGTAVVIQPPATKDILFKTGSTNSTYKFFTGDGNNRADLRFNQLTENRAYTFPDAAGTVALTSDIPTPVTPGDGGLTIQTAGEGASATGTFTANQSGASTITLPTIRYEDLSGTPTIPAAAGDGALTIQTAGEGASATGSFTANQSTASTITLPTIRYQDLSGPPTIPTVNDGSLTLKLFDQAGDDQVGAFTANGGNSTITLPQIDYDKLANKPTIPSPVTPGDGALTIQTAGEGASATGSFTADQSGASTITLPTIRYEDLSGTPTIPSDYVLPVATDSVLGGIKVGARLTITGDGVLSADIQGGGGTTVGSLQEVTDEGNTTTQPATFASLTTTSGNYLSDTGLNLQCGGTGILVFKTKNVNSDYRFYKEDSSNYGNLRFDQLTGNYTFTFPDKAGTVALLDDITTPTLQEVTDAGNTTTNNIVVNGKITLQGNGTLTGVTTANIGNLTVAGSKISGNGTAVVLEADDTKDVQFKTKATNSVYKFFTADGSFRGDLRFGNLTSNRSYTFPDATGTIALTSDIPTGATPTLQEVTDAGNTTTNGATFQGDVKASATNGNVAAGAAAGCHITGAGTAFVTSPSSGNLFVGYAEGNSTPVYYVKADGSATFGGDVGIGTDSPAAKLHTVGSDNEILKLENSGNTFQGIGFYGTGDALKGRIKTSTVNSNVYIEADPSDLSVTSSINFSVDGTERAQITSDGSLGIGGTLPGSPNITLSANGDANLTGNVYSGGNPNAGAANGARLLPQGQIYVSNATANANLWRGYTTGNTTWTSEINADGSAKFGANSIELTADGRVVADSGKFGNLLTSDNTILGTSNVVLEAGGTAGVSFKTKNTNGDYNFYSNDGTNYGKLRFGGLTTNRTYTFPDAGGTLALTSDIPSTTNFVTIDTDQTITGVKTFTSKVTAANFDIDALDTLP